MFPGITPVLRRAALAINSYAQFYDLVSSIFTFHNFPMEGGRVNEFVLLWKLENF